MSDHDQPDERYDFENFPYQRLNFGLTRRQLWASLATNVQVYSGKAEGGTAYKLADLGCLPEEILAAVLPQVVPGCAITVEDGFVWGQPPGKPQAARLFPLDSPALTAFNLFNGQTALLEVSRQLSEAYAWDMAHSFAYARGLFLVLILTGVCLPAGGA